MKKLFIAALIVVAAGTSAFALDGKKVDNRVKNNFDVQFAGAENVSWTAKENYFKASFILEDENIEAFFAKDGELIGTSHHVELKKLPFIAVKKIKKEYASYKVTDSIEFEQDGNTNFYVSLEDGNRKQILQVTPYGNVSEFKGEKK